MTKSNNIPPSLKRQLASLTIPIFIETLLVMALGAIDTFMLSQYSDTSVAAVGVVNQIVMFSFLVFQVINLGTSVLVSQYLGAGLKQRLSRVIGVSLFVNLIVGVVVSLVLYLCAEPILFGMGLSDELLSEGTGYMRIVGIFAFFQAIQMTVSAVLRACNKAVYPMLVIGACNVLNIIGNYMLIFGNFGAPALGSEGAAVSTVIGRGLAMVALIIVMMRVLPLSKLAVNNIHSADKQYGATVQSRTSGTGGLSWLRHFPVDELRNLLKIGLPSAGEQASYSAAQLVITYFINMMGLEAMAARTYVVNIVMFGYLFCIAISQSGAIIVGHLVGRNRTQGAFVMGKYVLRMSVAVTVTLSVAIAICGHVIFGMLTSNLQIIALGTGLLWVDIAVETGRPINIFATNALRGVGDVNYPFYVGLVVMWTVQVLGGYIVSIVLSLGIYAMWAMIAADENIRGAIFVRRWWSMKWAGKSFVHTP